MKKIIEKIKIKINKFKESEYFVKWEESLLYFLLSLIISFLFFYLLYTIFIKVIFYFEQYVIDLVNRVISRNSVLNSLSFKLDNFEKSVTAIESKWEDYFFRKFIKDFSFVMFFSIIGNIILEFFINGPKG